MKKKKEKSEYEIAQLFDRFLKGWSGKRLLKEHSLSEYGTWKVQGEDRNCDLGGPRQIPSLGVYEGRLENVIRLAVALDGFWHWGAGGDITPVSVEKVDEDTWKKKLEIKEEIRELEEQLDKAKQKLRGLE